METLALLTVLAAIIYALYCVNFILFQEKFLFRPKKLSKDYVHPCPWPHEELFLKTDDGETINAMLIYSKQRKGLVIYYHGNMLHLSNYLPYTTKFTEENYDVLIADYRGFGKSTGHLTERNFYDDSLMIYDWAEKNCPGEPPIIYGRSMGSAAATYVASKRKSKLLLLEAPFYNLYDLSWYYGMVLPKGNYLKYSFSNNEFLPLVKSPITIFHGTKDAIVSFRSGKKLQPLLKESDQFIVIEGGGHNNLEQFEKYQAELERLLSVPTRKV